MRKEKLKAKKGWRRRNHTRANLKTSSERRVQQRQLAIRWNSILADRVVYSQALVSSNHPLQLAVVGAFDSGQLFAAER